MQLVIPALLVQLVLPVLLVQLVLPVLLVQLVPRREGASDGAVGDGVAGRAYALVLLVLVRENTFAATVCAGGAAVRSGAAGAGVCAACICTCTDTCTAHQLPHVPSLSSSFVL
jgi:hypothetical protein